VAVSGNYAESKRIQHPQGEALLTQPLDAISNLLVRYAPKTIAGQGHGSNGGHHANFQLNPTLHPVTGEVSKDTDNQFSFSLGEA